MSGDVVYLRRAPASVGSPFRDILLPADDDAAARIAKLPLTDLIPARIMRGRSLQQHRLFWKLLQVVAEASQFETAERLLLALKIRMGFYDLCRLPSGKTVPAPRSIAFDALPQDEFRDFFDRAVALVCSEVLPDTNREELVRQVETLLGNPPLPETIP
jgi:hypothetical protein